MGARISICPLSDVFCVVPPDPSSGSVTPRVIAFDWAMMYDVVDGLGEGRNWWELWLAYIMRYSSLRKFSSAQLSALSLLYTHFQQASMDFVQLMSIDFPGANRCQCARPFQDMVADGITVSCQVRNLSVVAPFAAASADAELVWGSKFAERVYLRSSRSRGLLHELTTGRKGVNLGLSAESWDELCGLLRTSHPRLLGILEAAVYQEARGDAAIFLCRIWGRDFFRSLSSNSPACVIIRPAQEELVRRFVASSSWASELESREAHAKLPVLFKLMDHATLCVAPEDDERPALIADVVEVLRDLLEVTVLLACFESNGSASCVDASMSCVTCASLPCCVFPTQFLHRCSFAQALSISLGMHGAQLVCPCKCLIKSQRVRTL
jgi:hypothetical protein